MDSEQNEREKLLLQRRIESLETVQRQQHHEIESVQRAALLQQELIDRLYISLRAMQSILERLKASGVPIGAAVPVVD